MTSTDAAIGFQLARTGRLADALPYLERANRLAPADAALLHATASLLQRFGRAADAVRCYEQAAALLPENAGILVGWARALLLAGDPPNASALIGKALAADARIADPQGPLDVLLLEIGDPDTTRRLLHPLVPTQPLPAGLLRILATALLALDRPDEARDVLERLRDAAPSDPYAQVELGRLAVSRGDEAEAVAHFHAALAIDPDYPATIWELAQAQGGRMDPGLLERVERLARTVRDPKGLAGLNDLLARQAERTGDFDGAARHFERTNALMASIVPPSRRYDPARHEADIARTIEANTPGLLERLRDAGSDDARPVFIVGLPRSGTTLLEQMLASHPAVAGVGEQPLAMAGLERAIRDSGSWEGLRPQAVAAAAHWHLAALDAWVRRHADGPTPQRLVDKMPDNYLVAGWLRIAFPRATIVHCLRDPRDVALSCWTTQFADVPWSFDLAHIAHRIEQHRRILRHWRGLFGAHLVEVRYEDLVDNPASELQRILAATGIPWDPAMLDFSRRGGFVASASRRQVREPLHARSVGRWRSHRAALAEVLPRLDAVAARDEGGGDAAAPA